MTDTLARDLAAGWRAVRQRALQAWTDLPPRWRGESARLAAGMVAALVLLATFHQVVQAGVERAAQRQAAAHRHQALAATCSIEREAARRALCLLTRPAGRGDLQVAAAVR